MTIDELKAVLYEQNYPKSYEVDAATYGLAVQAIIENKNKNGDLELLKFDDSQMFELVIFCGPNLGIYFKNVELILEK